MYGMAVHQGWADVEDLVRERKKKTRPRKENIPICKSAHEKKTMLCPAPPPGRARAAGKQPTEKTLPGAGLPAGNPTPRENYGALRVPETLHFRYVSRF